MQALIAPEIEKDAELASAVNRANDLLKSELGPSDPVVTVKWQLVPAHRQRAVDLEVADPMVSVQTRFDRKELTRNGARLQFRLHRLWGDLLKQRSAKHLQRIQQLLRELDEGE